MSARQLLLPCAFGSLAFLSNLAAALEGFGYLGGGLAALLGLFVLPGSGLAALLWGWRRRRPAVRLLGGSVLVAAIASGWLAGEINARKEGASRALGDELARQLEHFRELRGRYPRALDELVPVFRAELPVSRMGICPDRPFRYHLAEDGADYSLAFAAPPFQLHVRGEDGRWVCED